MLTCPHSGLGQTWPRPAREKVSEQSSDEEQSATQGQVVPPEAGREAALHGKEVGLCGTGKDPSRLEDDVVVV